MNKREFIKKSMLTAGGLMIADQSLLASINNEKFPELSKHKIQKIELVPVEYRWPRIVGKNGAIDIHGQYKKREVLKIYSDQGALGWGISDGRAADQFSFIQGKSVSELITPDNGLTDELNIFYFDLPLFDLMGVILNKPVHEILGGSGNKMTSVYSGMIYLDELASKGTKGGIDTVMENCAWDYGYGYRQLKIKIGRGKNWYPAKEGMEMDIKIVKMIYEEYKNKGVDILMDSNNTYTLEDIITFLKGIGDIPLYWVEEPFQENMETGRKLRKWMDENGFVDTLYADGEWVRPDVKEDVALNMVDAGVLNTYLNDIHVYGMTNWMKVMPRLEKANGGGSPHAWGDRLKTHYIAHLAAGLGNVPTIEGVTCFSEDIDYGDYPIRNGKIKVSDKPGFGMKLLK